MAPLTTTLPLTVRSFSPYTRPLMIRVPVMFTDPLTITMPLNVPLPERLRLPSRPGGVRPEKGVPSIVSMYTIPLAGRLLTAPW